MVKHTDSLDFASETESERLARLLAENDAEMLWQLVERRRLIFTQQEMAEKIGVTQATIAAFERYDNDPKLSTLRRYAHAVGALVSHEVSSEASAQDTYEVWEADAVIGMSLRSQTKRAVRTGWNVANAS